ALAQGETDPSLHIPISTYLAQVYYSRAEYRAAADLFRQNLKKLVGPLVYERFGMLQMPSVHLRTCLAWCLEELGEFADAVEAGTEAVALARSVVHPLNLAVACAGLGSVYLQRGHCAAAIEVLEQGLEVCRTANVPVWLPRVAGDLGLAYARSGRLDEAVTLLEEAVARG